MKCPNCKTENGMTMYIGKVCKKCGKDLVKIDKDLKKKVKKEIRDND